MSGLRTTAADMARTSGIDPKRFRAALRSAALPWHSHNESWEVCIGSSKHKEMERILARLPLAAGIAPAVGRVRIKPASFVGASSDESWIIDLCDAVLEKTAIRQHHFPFLLGDPSSSGRRMPLPVDAFYPDLRLVIEYHERQHSEPVRFFDRRLTVSGMPRGEQRRRYDERRRTVLPLHGYVLVEFGYSEFAHTGSRRLVRTEKDRRVIEVKLRDHMPRP